MASSPESPQSPSGSEPFTLEKKLGDFGIDESPVTPTPLGPGNPLGVSNGEKRSGDTPLRASNRSELDNLTYRPFVLQTWFLFLVVGFDSAVIILLIALWCKPKFTLLNEWAYFVLQIFPTIIGTVTATSLEAIITSLSRITPFIHCAREGGSLAGTSIMLPYMPCLGLRTSFLTRRAGNWHLLLANVVNWLSYFVLGLKAALLYASFDEGYAVASDWPLYSLFWVYVLIVLFIVFVWSYLRERRTGLREGWDTVNIADHLVLFRHSNFLDTYEGSCIATRESMEKKLGNMRLELDFWDRDGEAWYGFQETTEPPVVVDPEREEDPQLSIAKLSRLRFNSVFSVMEKTPRTFFFVLALVMLVGYVAALAVGSRQTERNTFDIPISLGWSAFLFSFLPPFLLSLFGLFWEEMYLFAAITQPFQELTESDELSEKDGASADGALLLNYTSVPRPVAVFDAAARGHVKIVTTGILALLQRLLPIIGGASITIVPHDRDQTASIVQFSLPLGILIVIYLVVYVIAIPYEVFESGFSRHLPRDCLTIADLLSWTCSSQLLRDNSVSFNPDSSETGLLEGNPLDTHALGARSQKWYMEARLRLAQKRYTFGLEQTWSKPGSYMIGIHMENSEEAVSETASEREVKREARKALALHRPAKGLRRRIARLKDEEEANSNGKKYTISGAKKFVILGGGENNVNVSETAGPQTAQNAGREVGEEEEEEEE